MSRIIAGIYEIDKEIGSGGGGIVYIGKHLRLNKRIVLKADKRTLSVGTEKLRREVDLLKDLSHMYIPKVYDFVQSEGVVYTVMDYIEGESLDKLLKRGERPTQPQVIYWACQLLEALKYLHTYPPYGILHGDLKPANIMLRPDGTICLIDFNIALALGEHGAVKVGHSRGYASPEHYGSVDIQSQQNTGHTISEKTLEDDDSTQTDANETLPDDNKTGGKNRNFSSAFKRTTNGKNLVLLDVRSDIYSLGATLYHLLSGKRPEQNALEVSPLDDDICSPAISKIIKKAMAPVPSERYQSAVEMLDAFRQLHRSDERAVKHRKCKLAAACFSTGLFLVGGLFVFIGLKQLEQRQRALTLAEYSSNELERGAVGNAVRLALQGIPAEKSIFEAPVTAQSQMALTNALGVYDLSDGFKSKDILELPAVPFDIEISPGEKYLAVVYAYEMAVFEIETQEKVAVLPSQKSALSDVVFVDDLHLIFAGIDGVTAYDLEKKKILWTGETATSLSISEDRKRVAAVDRKDSRAVIYQTADGEKVAVCDFGELHMDVPENDIFADAEHRIFSMNQDGSMLAVSFSNGDLVIFYIGTPDKYLLISQGSKQRNYSGGFCGKYFAYRTQEDHCWNFRLIDVEKGSVVGEYESEQVILLSVIEQEIYIANGGLLIRLDPETLKESEMAYVSDSDIVGFSVGKNHTLVATDKNELPFFDRAGKFLSSETSDEISDFIILKDNYAVTGNRNAPRLRFFKLENKETEHGFRYDFHYIHDEARVSSDRKTMMLFSVLGFQIYDAKGCLLKEIELPDPEKIYDQQFVRDKNDSWLEVIWYDGIRRCYSASDGTMIFEGQGEIPQRDLYEEFYVDQYKITSDLHEAPKVYERKNNRLVATLEEDSYLTYVTKIDEYILTEYIRASGERYGLLLNQRFEKIAYLPNLCDVVGDTFVFDDKAGNLRQCRLYSLQELVSLGERFIQKLDKESDLI